MKRKKIWTLWMCWGCLFLAISMSSCTKVELEKMDDPAYLRVFNTLRFRMTLENKQLGLSVITMLVDPEFNAEGEPISAGIVGDYLITRNLYAAPYPSFIGNSVNKYNPEYPGKEIVMSGPILNGFDLSSWAQVPSGKHRFAFYIRPRSEVSFFKLDKRYREKPIVDTVINLDAKEVYTMQVLQEDFQKKTFTSILRQENFHKQAFADSLVYVNFYNYSARGFFAGSGGEKPEPRLSFHSFIGGIPDNMNVYYSLYDVPEGEPGKVIPSHELVYMTNLRRKLDDPKPSKYFSMPLRKAGDTNMQSNLAQVFNLGRPWVDVHTYDASTVRITCFKNGLGPTPWAIGTLLPSMIVTTHSGIHNPRSFGTVNSLEIINNDAYLTTIQRVYEKPIY